MTLLRTSVAGAILATMVGASRDATAAACQPGRQVAEVTPEESRAFVAGDGRNVVTFLGYSGAEYEDRAAASKEAADRPFPPISAGPLIPPAPGAPSGSGRSGPRCREFCP